MTYHVARNNQQLGTFAKDDLLQRYNAGAILPTDLVWTDGMATWEPASTIFGEPVAPGQNAFTGSSTPPPHVPVPPPITGVATPIPQGAGGAAFTTPLNPDQRPANGMVLSIVATVLNVIICNLLGLVCSVIAIVMSSQVNQKFLRGDLAGAQSSAKTGKILGWIGIGLFAFGLVVSILYFAVIMAQHR